jgi:hypothetical protein
MGRVLQPAPSSLVIQSGEIRHENSGGRRVKYLIGACLASAVLLGGCQKAAPVAEDPAVAAAAARWAALSRLPDWSGVWEIDWRNTRGSPPRPQMKLTPEYQARLEAYRKAQQKGENLQSEGANCVPPGLPGIMSQPYPIEFLYQPDKIVLLTEAYMQFRHLWTDGRPHPVDPDPSYHGHSVAHWEGDTLVVDSVGFVTSTLLAPGVPHSDQLRITEKIRKAAPEWLEIETTLTDPVVLAEPYTSTISYRHLDDELREYVCLENNRDAADEKGRPSLKLE